MIAIAATLLSSAAQAFLDAVAGTISDDLARRLKADPAVVAYKVALATAIQRYSTPERLTLARALTGERSILTSREVAGELSQILRFDREPNYYMIGRSWMDELDDPPRWRDFSDEARLLTHYLRQELQASDAYRPVFEAKSLEAVAVQTAAAAESLVAIEAGLGRLLALMDTRLGELSSAIARATAGIRNQIRDFASGRRHIRQTSICMQGNCTDIGACRVRARYCVIPPIRRPAVTKTPLGPFATTPRPCRTYGSKAPASHQLLNIVRMTICPVICGAER